MSRYYYLVMAIIFAVFSFTPAEARRAHTTSLAVGCNVLWPCETPHVTARVSKRYVEKRSIERRVATYHTRRHVARSHVVRVREAAHVRVAVALYRSEANPVQSTSGRGQVIGGRPSGCPYQFCGCGASLYLFGKIIPELNLAANWLRKFARAAPAPRMAAARAHHVLVLVEHKHGNVWLVHDSNSGGHQTRLHERDISSYTVVNPNAG